MNGSNIKDYYYILGLPRNATKEEIKTAYRKLSIKFHPDKNDGDKFFEERFKDIQEAYDTLSDDAKRKIYDDNLNYADNTASSEKTQTRDQQGFQQTAGQAMPRRKNKLKQFLYGLIALVVFSSPAWMQPLIHYLNEKESQEKKANKINNIINQDTTKHDKIKKDTSGDEVILLRVIEDSSGLTPPATTRANDKESSNLSKDDDGFTGPDLINRFFNAFNHKDCHEAWNLTYHSYWINKGEDWFCSAKAFGGVSGVMVYDIQPITQSNTAGNFFVEYYAEDIYNGNKCFKQTITVQEIEYSDHKWRWRLTGMKDDVDPVACSGY